ncbi:hypothetical protein KKF05_00665 [Patescibacteria group bacterium]|nr:hypothetical protein [Patescibacteria group bacterium]MBU1029206.1 hypothetical protein [Patescibacteria group bacterium]
MSREQKQVTILSILVLGIIFGLIYFNFDRLKPRIFSGAVWPQGIKLPVETTKTKLLFERSEYKKLTEFGSVPVRPLGVGSANPFVTEAVVVMGE